MEEIYKNEDLLSFTNGSYYIHDATVTRFDIYLKEYQLCIDVYFSPLPSKIHTDKQLKIHFSDIIRYQFLWSNDYNFYTVSSYKFFKCDEGYYLSLDPTDEIEKISNDDEDVILCKSVEGYW